MVQINIILPDDLDKKLRDKVFERKGMKKGNIKEAIVEAIMAWVESDNYKK